jgi:hypothetical protein
MKIYQHNMNDCLNCSLATLLEMEYEDIPKFYEQIADMENCTKEEGIKFDELYYNWIKENNLFSVYFSVEYKEGKMKFPFLSKKPFKFLGIVSKKYRSYSHSVILELNEEDNISIWHDPKRNSDYTINDLTGIELLFPMITVNSK